MYLRDNPVLAHELLVNLRMRRAFILMFLYVLALGAVVYIPWPAEGGVEIGAADKAQQLFNIFFLGQFALVALMAPSYAAGSITGEKERKTYELLIATPLEPGALLVGKLLSSLCYLTLLIMSSAPLMVLCWLLGGLALNEIVMAYGVLFLSAGTFGLVSLGTSSYFGRTSSSLVVSYLVILPLALLCLSTWQKAPEEFRVFAGIVLLPPLCLATWAAVVSVVNRRLLYPPDVGSEGREVVDEETEQAETVGLVIRRDMFPDWLFAPAKRTDLMEDGTNPVLDKELRSEIFSQGTLMLRVVIQVSMLLSIVIMAIFMFFFPDKVGYYIAYVIVFNMLVGPVFSAASVTQERERQTLELLLTTLLQPSQIIFAKLISSLRISTVLTLLLTEQIVLAYVMVEDLHPNWLSMFIFFAIILATCLLTSTLGLFCSVLCRKTSAAMILTYVVMLALFFGPIAIVQFLQPFTTLSEAEISRYTVTSPFSAIFSVPLQFRDTGGGSRMTLQAAGGGFPVHWVYLGFVVGLSSILLILMDVLFRLRWRAASQGAAA
jgi:ABC-type transport system involved in multi-copper enzyme maturation permease subunit